MSQDYSELAAYLREHFFYRPLTGELLRHKGSGLRKPRGSHRARYRVVRIKATQLYMHRAIWLWRYSTLPPSPLELDHINQDKHDNRISNLRVVTRGINIRNCHSRKGYSFYPDGRKKPWRAQVIIRGTHHKKAFATEDEAKAWVKRVRRQGAQTEL